MAIAGDDGHTAEKLVVPRDPNYTSFSNNAIMANNLDIIAEEEDEDVDLSRYPCDLVSSCDETPFGLSAAGDPACYANCTDGSPPLHRIPRYPALGASGEYADCTDASPRMHRVPSYPDLVALAEELTM